MKKLLFSIVLGLAGITVSAQNYCTPTYTNACSSGDDIDDVTIGNFSQLGTGCSTGNYADYSATDTVDLPLATPTAVSLTSNWPTQYFAIWIDFNDDGDFDDTDEHLWSSTGGSSSNWVTSLNLASTLTQGYHRLRIRSSFSSPGISASGSCTNFFYGETHDYTVNVLPPPACPAPTGIAFTQIGMDSAVATYAGNGIEAYFEFGPTGFTPGAGTVDTSSSTSTWLYGLTANTVYDVYVSTMCADSSLSIVYGPVSFSTASCAITDLCTYDFILVDSYGDGWNGALAQVKDANGTVIATLGTNFTTGSSYTESVDLCSGLSYTVELSTAGGYPSEVGLDVESYGANVSSYAPGSASTGTVMASFTSSCNTACPAPLSVAFTSTDSSFTASWWSNDTTFNVEYGPVGFTPGSGAGVIVTVSDTFFTATNLASGTGYNVYIQTDCQASSNGVSSTVGPKYVETLCSYFAVSFFEGFENDSLGSSTAPNAPNCWYYTEEAGAQGYGHIMASAWNVSPRTGTQMYNLNAGGDAFNEALVSPYIIGLTDGDKSIEFYTNNGNWNSMDIVVGTVLSPNDLSTFELLDTLTLMNNATWEKQTIYVDAQFGYGGVNPHIAIMTTSNAGWNSIYIDDIDVKFAPQCLPPTAISVSNVGQDSALVSWTGTGTGYFEYGPTGFTMGQGTGVVVPATGTTTWLTGLSSTTGYDVYVYQVCPDGSVSPGFGPATFTTPACSGNNLCSYDIELVDSFGDGWNGAEVDLVDANGNVISTYGSSFITGSSFIIPIGLCSGNTFSFVVSNAGSFPSEIGINVIKGGSVVASYAPVAGTASGTVMTTFTTNCNLSCPSLSDLVVTPGKNNAIATFNTNGNTGMFVYEYGPTGFVQGTGIGGVTIDSTTSSTFTLTGLSAGDCYDVYLYANCAANGYSDTLGPVSFCTGFCDASEQCHYKLAMYDTFGDGWNGASITLDLNGVVNSYSCSGDSTIVDLYICAGTQITVNNAVSGSYDYEIYYSFYDMADPLTVIEVTPGNYSVGVAGTDVSDCVVPSCPAPSNITASSISHSSATLSWTGGTGSFIYELTQSGLATPLVSTTPTASTSLTGLTPSTHYFFQVAEVCAPGDTSIWMNYEFDTDSCSMVIAGNPTATITNVTQVDGTVTFDWSSSSNFTGYSIDFGNGQNTSGTGTTATATYTANGSYTAALTLYNDCDTITQNVTVFMSGISIDEVAVARSITMFPNPTTALVNIQVNLFEAGDVELSVLNALGQVVASHEAFANNDLQHTFDLSAMASGTYVVRVSTAQGLMQKTVVVRH